tara:strand:- start:1005 stop:1745 length:741 start_codon:yes stop_codon:yes gene_type:complete
MKNWEENEDFLKSVEKPTYEGRYCAIPHDLFIDEVNNQLTLKGMEIEKKNYLIANKGQIMIGEYSIKAHDSEMNISISFRNSYNKQVSASIKSGAIVLVCSNGMYSIRGESFKRKHLGVDAFRDTQRNISLSIDNAEVEYKKLLQDRDELKRTRVTNKIIAELVGDMYLNESIITETQLSLLKNELKFSKHFTEDNAWCFYNNVTEVLKDNHPTNYIKQHLKVYSYLSDAFDLTNKSGLYKKALLA